MNDDQTQQITQPVDQPQAPTVPVSSITPTKESEPITASVSQATEYIKPSEVSPAISKEVAEAGVEAVSEVPSITPQHKEIGIEMAKESVPVATQPTGAVQLPQSQKEAEMLLKKNSDTRNSLTWLIMSLIRRFKIAYYVQHGKSNEKQTV